MGQIRHGAKIQVRRNRGSRILLSLLCVCSCRPILGLTPLLFTLLSVHPHPLVVPALHSPTRPRRRRPQHPGIHRRQHPHTGVASRDSPQPAEATRSPFPPPTPAWLGDRYRYPALVYSPPLWQLPLKALGGEGGEGAICTRLVAISAASSCGWGDSDVDDSDIIKLDRGHGDGDVGSSDVGREGGSWRQWGVLRTRGRSRINDTQYAGERMQGLSMYIMMRNTQKRFIP